MKKYFLGALGRIGLLWQQPTIAPLVYLNFLLIGSQFILILVLGRLLPPLIPLFYSRPWGQLQLTSPNFLFLLPALSLAVLFLNSLLTTIFLKETIFAQLYTWTSNLFAFLLLLALSRLFFTFLF